INIYDEIVTQIGNIKKLARWRIFCVFARLCFVRFKLHLRQPSVSNLRFASVIKIFVRLRR
ncbi:MAG: hypothetical protein IKP24_00175, partial [Alphaproteobacteria bacterium]|nr:hypothetical protein [Alphaproteobacteria bacterium]